MSHITQGLLGLAPFWAVVRALFSRESVLAREALALVPHSLLRRNRFAPALRRFCATKPFFVKKDGEKTLGRWLVIVPVVRVLDVVEVVVLDW